MVHRPLFLDPLRFRLLPEDIQGINCDHCDKRQARWEYFSPEVPLVPGKGYRVCSLCWLYDSEWGKRYDEDIELMIDSVDLQVGGAFERDVQYRLVKCVDADRIIASVVLTSRVVMRGGSGPV